MGDENITSSQDPTKNASNPQNQIPDPTKIINKENTVPDQNQSINQNGQAPIKPNNFVFFPVKNIIGTIFLKSVSIELLINKVGDSKHFLLIASISFILFFIVWVLSWNFIKIGNYLPLSRFTVEIAWGMMVSFLIYTIAPMVVFYLTDRNRNPFRLGVPFMYCYIFISFIMTLPTPLIPSWLNSMESANYYSSYGMHGLGALIIFAIILLVLALVTLIWTGLIMLPKIAKIAYNISFKRALLLAVVSVSIFIYFVFQGLNLSFAKPPSAPEQMTIPNKTATNQSSPSTQIDETANWKKYTNRTANYSIQYPNNWGFRDIDIKLFPPENQKNLISYTSFSEVYRNQPDFGKGFIETPRGDPLLIVKNTQGKTLQQIVDDETQSLTQGGRNYQVKEMIINNIDNIPAILIVTDTVVAEPEYYFRYFFINEQKVYEFTFSTSNESAFPIYEQMLSSINFAN